MASPESAGARLAVEAPATGSTWAEGPEPWAPMDVFTASSAGDGRTSCLNISAELSFDELYQIMVLNRVIKRNTFGMSSLVRLPL
jgi:hypothetical protein